MPLKSGSSQSVVSENIRELHTGKTYAHTAGKFGNDRANKQAIAIALSEARKSRAVGGGIANYDTGGGIDPVNAVITALTAGSQNGGGGGIGSSNAAAPSSPASTASTSPTNIVAQNAAPASSTPAPAATPIAPTTAGIAQAAPAVPPTPAAITAPVAPTSTVASQPTYQNGIALPAATSTLSTLNSNAQLLAEGGVANRAGGGGFNMFQGPALTAPWQERQEARGLHVGPVLSNVPGRTDSHQVKVPAGAYVVPASSISAFGHGNTLAGMSIASKMFGMPYGGGPSMKIGGGHSNMPKPPRISSGPGIANLSTGGTYSEGGSRGEGYAPDDLVPVDIAGGEHVIEPAEIIRRWGSLKNGHAVLDQFIMDERKKDIKTLRDLPPPAKE